MSRAQVLMGVFGLFSIGCSVSAEEYGGDEAGDSTHVAVRIRHVTDGNGATRGDALAGFVRAPENIDISEVLTISGLGLDVPPRGECFSEGPAISDFKSLGDAELLEVDSVRLETESGTHELAPFAFPTVADLLRGVVYLSRDQSGDTLPPGSSYTLLSEGLETGADSIELVTTQTSPSPLSGVTIGGTALSDSVTLSPGPVADLRWDPGELASDLVVVTLESEDDFWACTFADTEGFGSVPLLTSDGVELGAEGRSGVLTIHRVRATRNDASAHLPPVTITFDFALETEIRFSAKSAPAPSEDSNESDDDSR